MSSRRHRVGLYFGVAKETAEDRRRREASPAPSVTRLVLGSVFGAVVGGAIIAILDGSVGSGVRFGVFELILLNGLALWRRRPTS